MGLMDKFLDAMRLNDEFEDDYEFDNDDYEEDDYEEPKKTPSRKVKREVEKEVKEEPKKTISKITPITKNTKKDLTGANMEVCVIKPNGIEEEVEVVDTLLAGRTVLINMEGLNIEVAQRIIDFTSGATYAINGNLQKVSNYIFLATPHGVDISGDFPNLMEAYGIDAANALKF